MDLLFYPPIARTLKRGTLLSSLILSQILFASFCRVNSFVLNELLLFTTKQICWCSAVLLEKLFDNIVSSKLLWWDEERRSKLVKANAGENIERPPTNLDWQESERSQKYHKESERRQKIRQRKWTKAKKRWQRNLHKERISKYIRSSTLTTITTMYHGKRQTWIGKKEIEQRPKIRQRNHHKKRLHLNVLMK